MTKSSQETTLTEFRRRPRVVVPLAHRCPLRISMVDADRRDHLLMSMAADAADLDASLSFFADGDAFVEHLEASIEGGTLPDLILLEWRQPGFNGQRILEALQGHDVLWQIPVIVFTRSSRRIDQSRALACGARWFEVKPQRFSGMVEFARTLPDRANAAPYALPDDDFVLIDLTAVGGEAITRERPRPVDVAHDSDRLA